MFERTLAYLIKCENKPFRLGAKLTPPYDEDTIEGIICKHPYPLGRSSYKVSPHICDILAIIGVLRYVLMINPKTGRRVTGVKLIDQEQPESNENQWKAPINDLEKPVDNKIGDDQRKSRRLTREENFKWSKKYDADHPWWCQKEEELGDKFRRIRELTMEDLVQIVTWKFKTLKGRQKRIRGLLERNKDNEIRRISRNAFSLTPDSDFYRVGLLKSLYGIGPALASTILTFYDLEQYGIFDIHVWRELFGPESTNLFTIKNYLKVLRELREIAKQHNLKVRVIEKALFRKNLQE